MSNLDLLEAFESDEREQCPVCEHDALVGVADAPLFRVCLSCAAVWVAGVRMDGQQGLPAFADG
jgi:hypothetical protein